MIHKNNIPQYTPQEETANVVTHSFGILLSLISLVILIFYSLKTNSLVCLVSSIIFALSMLILYSASTLYHSCKINPDILSHSVRKKNLRIFDHSSIYILISGSYTPFLLIPFHNHLSYFICAGLWICSLICISLKLFFVNSFKILSTLSYVAMGWTALFILKSLYHSVPLSAFSFIILGGIFYTSGVYFYLKKKVEYYHAIWHLFVLAGSLSHVIALIFILKNMSA